MTDEINAVKPTSFDVENTWKRFLSMKIPDECSCCHRKLEGPYREVLIISEGDVRAICKRCLYNVPPDENRGTVSDAPQPVSKDQGE